MSHNHNVKGNEQLISRHIHRPLAIKLASKLPLFFTPNLVTVLSLFCGVIPIIILLFNQNLLSKIFSIFFIHLSWILDLTDGEVARLHNKTSELGAWLDSIFDRIIDITLLSIIPIIIADSSNLIFFNITISFSSATYIALSLLAILHFYYIASSPKIENSVTILRQESKKITNKIKFNFIDPVDFSFGRDHIINLITLGILFDIINIVVFILYFILSYSIIIRNVIFWMVYKNRN